LSRHILAISFLWLSNIPKQCIGKIAFAFKDLKNYCYCACRICGREAGECGQAVVKM
jgi:hypothetical protein